MCIALQWILKRGTMKAAIKYRGERNKQQGVQGCSIRDKFQHSDQNMESPFPFSFSRVSLTNLRTFLKIDCYKTRSMKPKVTQWQQLGSNTEPREETDFNIYRLLLLCYVGQQDKKLLSEHPCKRYLSDICSRHLL